MVDRNENENYITYDQKYMNFILLISSKLKKKLIRKKYYF